jgi:FkbM family methyltransferase
MGKSSIYSFEGLPYYADLLVMTMKILRRSNIRVINAAVGEEVGIVNMVWKDESGKRLTGRSHVEESGAEVGKKIQVQIIALDDFWAEIGRKKVGFVKIDVEGSELFVLKGAMELIRQCRPIFYNELEYKWCQRYDYSPSDIFKLFSDMSYSPYLIVESRIIECDMYKYAGGDVLFVPDEKVSQIDMTDLKNK